MNATLRLLRRWWVAGAVALVVGAGGWLGAEDASAAGRSRSSAKSSGEASPRQAVPRGSTPSRTPSTRHRAPSRGHRSHGHAGVHYGYRYGHPYSYYHYSYWGHPFFWYGFYRPYYYGPVTSRVLVAAPSDLGAFDLSVRPRKAEVFVDGIAVGPARRFDGYPSYLWLEKGRHELVFYMPGYETAVRQVSVLPGTVAKLKLRMVQGEAVPPEQVMTRRPAPREQVAERPPPPPRERPRPPRAEPGETRPSGELDARGEPGRFRVRVEPADASIYLDGRFLGTGDELARLHSGLIVDPGRHQLEVVRPGYESRAVDFEVESGKQIELEVELSES